MLWVAKVTTGVINIKEVFGKMTCMISMWLPSLVLYILRNTDRFVPYSLWCSYSWHYMLLSELNQPFVGWLSIHPSSYLPTYQPIYIYFYISIYKYIYIYIYIYIHHSGAINVNLPPIRCLNSSSCCDCMWHQLSFKYWRKCLRYIAIHLI